MSDDERRPLLPPWTTNLFVVAIVATTSLVIWSLTEQNRLLKDQLTTTNSSVGSPFFEPGDQLPDTALTDLFGTDGTLVETISGGGVVAFLTTTCPYCVESLPEWTRISTQMEEAGISFAAVSLNSEELTREYVESREVAFPVWILSDEADRSTLKVGAVPLTLLASSDGAVVEVWRGQLHEQSTTEILESANNVAPLIAGSERW